MASTGVPCMPWFHACGACAIGVCCMLVGHAVHTYLVTSLASGHILLLMTLLGPYDVSSRCTLLIASGMPLCPAVQQVLGTPDAAHAARSAGRAGGFHSAAPSRSYGGGGGMGMGSRGGYSGGYSGGFNTYTAPRIYR
jgi:hypothetical protein